MRSTIVKFTLITGSILLATAFSQAAHADRYYDRHGYGGHKYGRYNHHGDRYYNRHYRHKRHRRHRSSDKAAYLVGGLVLGSIISNAYHRSEHYVERRVRYHEPRVYRSSHRVTRSLYRDRDGNCFERSHNNQGDELLVELDRAQCAW